MGLFNKNDEKTNDENSVNEKKFSILPSPGKCTIEETYFKFNFQGGGGFRIAKADLTGVVVNYVNVAMADLSFYSYGAQVYKTAFHISHANAERFQVWIIENIGNKV
jgi:hypothetical protein